MEFRGPESHTAGTGELAGAITRDIVHLFRERVGKGPTRARTYLQDDLAVCVLLDVSTQAERTLAEAGRAPFVRRERRLIRDVLEPELVRIVETNLGREVRSFLSDYRPEDDVTALVFLLA